MSRRSAPPTVGSISTPTTRAGRGHLHPEEGTGGGTTDGGSGEEGSSAAETAATPEHSESDAVFLGIDLESWWLVGVAVALSLGLWLRPVRPILALTSVVALAFAVFDVAEVSHQASASQTGLVAIAAVVAVLHLLTGGLALAAFKAPKAV
jgi:hypothetical protein